MTGLSKIQDTIMIVRHSRKGNGKPRGTRSRFGGSKQQLCRFGEEAARALILPECMSDVVLVGGSEIPRSLTAALDIAYGNGFEPPFLASDPGLGSLDFFRWFGENKELFEKTMKELKSEMLTIKKIMPAKMIEVARFEVGGAIFRAHGQLIQKSSDYTKSRGVILGTHSPILQIAIEKLTEERFDHNVAELAYIVVKMPSEAMGEKGHTIPSIVATNIPELATQLGIECQSNG